MAPLLQSVLDPLVQNKPLDVVALVQVTFTGLALVISAVGGVYAAVAATRAKRAEEATKTNNENIGKVQNDVKLIERNTNSMTTEIARLSRKEGSAEGAREAAAAGEETARILAEGRRQGVEAERASVAAAANTSPPNGTPKLAASEAEVPTRDKRVAEASERIATAQERAASAAEKKTEKP